MEKKCAARVCVDSRGDGNRELKSDGEFLVVLDVPGTLGPMCDRALSYMLGYVCFHLNSYEFKGIGEV